MTSLGLEKDLERADMVAAAKRKSNGITFYDYDLALSPKTCGQEMATACLSSTCPSNEKVRRKGEAEG